MSDKKSIFEYMENGSYEQIIFFNRNEVGLKGITCIHNTVLGPSTGGTRLYNYQSQDDALYDVTRLARGMTYKNACAELNLGGCKTVLIGEPSKVKSEAYFRAYGRHIQSLNGRITTGEDMNITPDDCVYMAMETDYVAGLPNKSGDPSIVTALGVYYGIKASVQKVFNTDSLDGKLIAIQGVGSVGYHLANHLINEGAKIYFTDVNKDRIDRFQKTYIDAIYVEPSEIMTIESDVFAPCAIGAIINDDTIDNLNCKIIAGAANNVLKETRHGELLHEKGILYAPDYVINAGGVINVYHEIIGYNQERALNDAKKIYKRLLNIYEISEKSNIPTYKAADLLAEGRINAMRKIKSNYIKR